MSTIIVRKPTPSRTTLPVHDLPPPDTYKAGLLELGAILLKDDDQTPWMSLRKISGQWKRHWAKLPRLNYSIRYLNDWARDFFPRCGEIKGERVKITCKTEPSGTRRPPDLFIQFVRVWPDGSCN